MFKWGQGGDAEGHSIWEKKQESEIDQEDLQVELKMSAGNCWNLMHIFTSKIIIDNELIAIIIIHGNISGLTFIFTM